MMMLLARPTTPRYDPRVYTIHPPQGRRLSLRFVSMGVNSYRHSHTGILEIAMVLGYSGVWK